MNTKRKVVVFEQIANPKQAKDHNEPSHITICIGTGVFHTWGSTFEEFDNGAVQCTVAVVEMPDGSIVTPDPVNIKFLDNEWRPMNTAPKDNTQILAKIKNRDGRKFITVIAWNNEDEEPEDDLDYWYYTTNEHSLLGSDRLLGWAPIKL